MKNNKMKTSVRENRASEEYARKVFESLYSGKTIQLACARLLADCIFVAHDESPSCWSLTLFANKIRLSVGPVEVLVLNSAYIFLLIADSDNKHLDKKKYREFVTKSELPYPSVKIEQRRCYVPPEMIEETYPLIRKDHRKLIQLAASTRSVSTWKYSFSSGVIHYLNKLLGIALPMPGYFTKKSQNKLSLKAPDEYVQYHNSDVIGELRHSDGRRFGISTSKSVSKLRGNRIWLISGKGKPKKYHLNYYFFADSIESLGDDADFKFSVLGQQGKSFEPAIPLSDFPWFKDFLKSQQNFSMGLRKIEKKFVEKLEEIILSQETPKLSVSPRNQRIGGGFGDSEINEKVEQAAISYVTNEYKKHGWTVKSVEAENCGYDLRCRKTELREHVEVKGIQGDAVSFTITAGEVRQAQADKDFVLCVVTSALSNPKLHRFTAKEFSEQFILEPISYRASKQAR